MGYGLGFLGLAPEAAEKASLLEQVGAGVLGYVSYSLNSFKGIM